MSNTVTKMHGRHRAPLDAYTPDHAQGALVERVTEDFAYSKLRALDKDGMTVRELREFLEGLPDDSTPRVSATWLGRLRSIEVSVSLDDSDLTEEADGSV